MVFFSVSEVVSDLKLGTSLEGNLSKGKILEETGATLLLAKLI